MKKKSFTFIAHFFFVFTRVFSLLLFTHSNENDNHCFCLFFLFHLLRESPMICPTARQLMNIFTRLNLNLLSFSLLFLVLRLRFLLSFFFIPFVLILFHLVRVNELTFSLSYVISTVTLIARLSLANSFRVVISIFFYHSLSSQVSHVTIASFQWHAYQINAGKMCAMHSIKNERQSHSTNQ